MSIVILIGVWVVGGGGGGSGGLIFLVDFVA